MKKRRIRKIAKRTKVAAQKATQATKITFKEVAQAVTLLTGIAAAITMTVMAAQQGIPGGDFLY